MCISEETAMRAENLKKTFQLSAKQRKTQKTAERTKTAVDELSFTVKKGEIYGLLGPNGAGKTTTLRMLATLIKPDSGDAFVNGRSVTKEADKVRNEIGFLTSELKPDEFFTPSYLFDFYSELPVVFRVILLSNLWWSRHGRQLTKVERKLCLRVLILVISEPPRKSDLSIW